MKMQKSELAGAFQKLKDFVPKKTTIPALGSVWYGNGDFIANNIETALTVKGERDGGMEESFLIPAKAMELICNLPDGEVEIIPGKSDIEIRAGRIHNRFATWKTEEFTMPMAMQTDEAKSLTIPAEKLVECIRHVLWAVGANSAADMMRCVSMQATGGTINFYGLDGHQIAWDQLDYEGEFTLNIPKEAAQRITTVGLTGDVSISTDGKLVSFSDGKYILQTRLKEGKYFNVAMMYNADFPIHCFVDRQRLLDALLRVKMCMVADEEMPVILNITDKAMQITYSGATSAYNETVDVTMDADQFRIAFNPLLMIENLRAFDSEEVEMDFINRKGPTIISSQEMALRTLLLPVNFVEKESAA